MKSIIIKFDSEHTMSRWDELPEDYISEDEENRLWKKFQDYTEIHKKESERKQFLEVSEKTPKPMG